MSVPDSMFESFPFSNTEFECFVDASQFFFGANRGRRIFEFSNRLICFFFCCPTKYFNNSFTVNKQIDCFTPLIISEISCCVVLDTSYRSNTFTGIGTRFAFACIDLLILVHRWTLLPKQRIKQTVFFGDTRHNFVVKCTTIGSFLSGQWKAQFLFVDCKKKNHVGVIDWNKRCYQKQLVSFDLLTEKQMHKSVIRLSCGEFEIWTNKQNSENDE